MRAVEEELTTDFQAAAVARPAGSGSGSSPRTQPSIANVIQRKTAASDVIVVCRDTVMVVVDALDRAHVAALHGQRLCSAAANVFQTEAQIIAEATNAIVDVLRSSAACVCTQLTLVGGELSPCGEQSGGCSSDA